MSNDTIVPMITSWAELRSSDRDVVQVDEAAALLGVDPRTVTSAIGSGELPGKHLGRRARIPRRAFLNAIVVSAPAA